ncbi:GDSL-type esterase/lipase family protein [Parabacteroides sp. Marseille-P3160]|uniref:GDSL-type esterase/lipase family protein n=1 Tax=Parabacteroides sp. Marseille-P3160 TaxID=1917887 RepID=UPI0009B94443|nr:GDSL-type esterase/lipase family protein [Parabacteroides sp. Marseille-P3160]
MKRAFLLILFVFPLFISAQQLKHSTFYEQRNSLFELLSISSDDIIFLGNSITNGNEWGELFNNIHIKNRGISGDISEGILDRLDNILRGKPKKIFLLIGINDIARNISVDSTVQNIKSIISKIQSVTPKTKLYLQSVLPVNSDFGTFAGHMKSDSIKNLNEKLKSITEEYSLRYIDLYSRFVTTGTNKLNPKYTNDGLHLMGTGYFLWRDILMPYVEEK